MSVASGDGPNTGAWPQLGALQLEDLLEELRSRAQLAQHAQVRLHSLLDAVVAVSSDLDLSHVLSRIVRSACQLVDARYGALGVLAPEGERLVEFITDGVSDEERQRIGSPPHGRGVLGMLIHDPRPQRLRDISAHPDSYGFPPNHPAMRSFLGAPVSIRGEVFGNLYMAEKRGAEEFTADDEAVLVALAAAAGVAIENARLYERAGRQRALADLTAELTQHLLEGGETDQALQLMADRSAELADAELAVVALFDNGGLTVRAVGGPSTDCADAAGHPLHPGRWADIVAEREPILLMTRPEESPTPEALAIRRLGADSPDGPTAIVAIAVGEAQLGVLGVAWDVEQDVVAASAVEQLSALGRAAALALEAASAQRDRGRMELLEDRDRIARDMHDHVIQRLFATGLSLQTATRMASDPRVLHRLEGAVDELDDAIKDIRTTIFALHRPTRGPGLAAEITEVVTQTSTSLGFTPVLTLDGELAGLPASIESEVLAVVREALANVVRHSRARSCQVRVHVGRELSVRVDDDGVGLPDGSRRSGLANLARRAERLGGRLTVSGRDPAGVTLLWLVPLDDKD